MKLLIFGATGQLGQLLVGQALDLGHQVTAVARQPASVTQRHPAFQVVAGDMLDEASIAAAVSGQDAALSATGVDKVSRNHELSEGTRHIVRALAAGGVNRFICVSSLGVGDSQGQLGWLFNWFLIPFLLRHIFADKERQEEIIKRSGLEWTIVRPGTYVRHRPGRSYRYGFPGTDRTVKGIISRPDAAAFMLQQLTDNTYLHQAVGVSY